MQTVVACNCISLFMQEDPYVMVRSAELEGYCIDLLKALASMLHFSYKVKVVGDGKYGAISPSGNWTGMIGEILRQVIFILCLRNCSVNRERSPGAVLTWLLAM